MSYTDYKLYKAFLKGHNTANYKSLVVSFKKNPWDK